MQKLILSFFILFMLVIVVQSCKKDDVSSVDEDATFFQEYKNSSLTIFRESDTLVGVAPSPHGSFRLYFNATAQAALGSDGNLPVGETFPEGSMIVKEIFSNGKPSLLALMKKDANNTLSASGWLWSEYGLDGSVVYSLGKKGAGCTGCHSGGTHRDLVKTFDLH